MNATTALLPHQVRAVDKMLPMRIGALFAEMGTGKSRMAIELALSRKERIDKVLWFCPVSLKETIRQEIMKHTDCTDQDIDVFGDRTNEQNIPSVFWHVVGIESMSSSNRVVLAVRHLITEQSMVIVDESSYIKGHDAVRTLRITKLADIARYRLVLTGTPISQGIVDLYSQMRFLSPKILGYRSFYSFAANHLEYDEDHPGLIKRSHNIPYLTAKIAPYVYQVTKEECLDLPKKLYETRYFGMTDKQRLAYEQAKEDMFAELEANESDWMRSVAIFRLFTTLQQIACGFWRRRNAKGAMEQEELPHIRIDMLLNIIERIPSSEKIIIWAKYQHDIAAISEALKEAYGDEALAPFHGGLNEKKRAEQVEHFRGKARFFLATQSCGGHGLTLNESCYAIYYNNGFKYAERLQSECRNHRYGQERIISYIDIQCSPSIDDRIAHALATKGNAVEVFKQEVSKAKDKQGIKKLIEAL